MPKYSIEDIDRYVLAGMLSEHGPDADLCEDYEIYGDEWAITIYEYSKKFNVDISTALWYFHNREEGLHGLGGLLFPPPYKRVKHIPVTPAMLLDFANKGKWNIDYPQHTIPKRRYDLIINAYFLYFAIALFLIFAIIRISS